jgi:hypothetical protein
MSDLDALHLCQLEKTLENIDSYSGVMRILQKERLPVLKRLSQGKGKVPGTQKVFLLEFLADFYCTKSHETRMCEMTEIMCQSLGSFELPDAPVNFECEQTIQKSILECIVKHIQNLPIPNIHFNYSEYTCGLIDRYCHDMRIASQMSEHRYAKYLPIVQNAVSRVQYYVRKHIARIEHPEDMPHDIEYTDTDSDNTDPRLADTWNIEPVLLVSPPKLGKSRGNCPICLDTHRKTQMVTTNCAHSFCDPCFVDFLKNAQGETRPVCPLCRTLIYQIDTHTRNVYEAYRNNTHMSSEVS